MSMLLSACFAPDARCWSSFRHLVAMFHHFRQTLAAFAPCAKCLMGVENVRDCVRPVPSTVGSVRGNTTWSRGNLPEVQRAVTSSRRASELCARAARTDTEEVAFPKRLAVPASRRRPAVARSSENAAARRPMNVALAVGLVAEARELGVDVSQAAEAGIAAAVSLRRQERWLTENKAALDSSNEYVAEHGLPLTPPRPT